MIAVIKLIAVGSVIKGFYNTVTNSAHWVRGLFLIKEIVLTIGCSVATTGITSLKGSGIRMCLYLTVPSSVVRTMLKAYKWGRNFRSTTTLLWDSLVSYSVM